MNTLNRIIVGDSAPVRANTSYNLSKTGIRDAALKAGANKVLDLKCDNVVIIKTGGVLGKIKVFKSIYDSDVVISTPKLKRHGDAAVTVSLKI